MELQQETHTKLFGKEFEELFRMARPSMSPFLVLGVEKMAKDALKSSSLSYQQNQYLECLAYMAMGIEFEISRKSKSMGTPEEHVRRLKQILDDLK